MENHCSCSPLLTQKKHSVPLPFLHHHLSGDQLHQFWFSIFLKPLLAMNVLLKAIFIVLTQHWPISTQPLVFSPYTWELQLYDLPAKPDLASREHTISSSTQVAKGVPSSAKMVLCPTCLTYNSMALLAPGLAEGGSSKLICSHRKPCILKRQGTVNWLPQ